MRTIVFWIALAVLAHGCSDVKETPNGMRFRVVRKGDGTKPRPGDIVAFNFRITDSGDSIWRDTYSNSFPIITKIGDSSKLPKERGLDQMLRMVSEGDSIIVNLSISEYYKDVIKRPVPGRLDSTKRLLYRVRIDSVLSIEAYRKWVRYVFQKKRDEQLARDIEVIDAYLNSQGINAFKIESGLRYLITRPGHGPNAKSGQEVTVNYCGYLLTGEYFSTNILDLAKEKDIYHSAVKYQPYKRVIDQPGVIPGWNEALKLLNRGAKGTFYIPSVLAYGNEKLDTLIDKHENLVFDIEVIDIK
jgi:FKBP-type peptidyl-prolyl cis-trans isomerase